MKFYVFLKLKAAQCKCTPLSMANHYAHTHISFHLNYKREKNWLIEQLESTRNPSWQTGICGCVINGIDLAGPINQQTYAISLKQLINSKNDTYTQLSDPNQ